MECAYCRTTIENDSAFCRSCGKPTRVDAAAPRRLHRRASEGRLGGVCAGIAEYLSADVTLVRLAAVILAVFPGGLVGGVLVYLAAWIIIPDAPGAADATGPTRRLTRSVSDRRLAGVCGGIAEYMAVDSTVIRLVWVVLSIVPGAIVFGVFAYFVAWLIMPASRPAALTAAPSAA